MACFTHVVVNNVVDATLKKQWLQLAHTNNFEV